MYLCMDKCPSSEAEFTENYTAVHPGQDLVIDNTVISPHKAKNLGATLDNGLSYASHILSTFSVQKQQGTTSLHWGSTLKRIT